MIAYSIKALLELEILEEAKKWLDKKMISDAQFDTIKEKHRHDLFIPNIFVRIGLFILTVILVNAALGLISVFNIFFDSTETVIGGFLFFFGLVTLTALEGTISIKKTYRAGIDDGLLYLSSFYLIMGVCLLFNDIIETSRNETLIYIFIAFPFLVAASIRYLDRLMAALSFGCFILIVFLIFLNAGSIGKSLIPFIIMISTAFTYFIAKKYYREDYFHLWKHNFWVVQFLSLLTFYLAGNYYMVRELSIEMLNMPLNPGEDIPFSILFHIATVLIPLIFILYGGKMKDRPLFICGLITLALSVLTFKYYYSFAPIGVSLTVSGILITALVWFCIKYFNPFKYEITSEKAEELFSSDAEALVISYSFPQHDTMPKNEAGFGGGSFGGGGA